MDILSDKQDKMKASMTQLPPLFASAYDCQNDACIPQFRRKEVAYIEGIGD